jgi:hypothetical protein
MKNSGPMLRNIAAIEMGMNDAFGISGCPGRVKENGKVILTQESRRLHIPSAGQKLLIGNDAAI